MSKTALIGYTGFVGSNIYHQMNFDDVYNSKNIKDIEGKSYDLCICAGIKAKKWYANAHPEEDYTDIFNLLNIIEKADIKRFVLISTIDVYTDAINVNEDTIPEINESNAYGLNRYKAEEWVKTHFNHYHIIRLPALFGKNLKKNFIYDLMNLVPAMLNEKVFQDLKIKMADDFKVISENYIFQNNAYVWNQKNENSILNELRNYDMTSLMFTDSNDKLQFYPLSRIAQDLDKVIKQNIYIVNFATEAVSANEIYMKIFNRSFENHLNRQSVNYDMRTKYGLILGHNQNYILDKASVLEELSIFYQNETKE